MLNPRCLLLQNLAAWLRDGLLLLDTVDTEQYTSPVPEYCASSIGNHYRHILEHIRIALDWSPPHPIDYDLRKRHTPLQSCIDSARRETLHLIERLEHTDPDILQEIVLVSQDAGPTWKNQVLSSTLERELLFVMSHSVHHFAMIALIARIQGADLPPRFGVMPSTLDAIGAPCQDTQDRAKLESPTPSSSGHQALPSS